MHFQIFVPHEKSASMEKPPETLARVGLADLSLNASVQTLMSGPLVDGEKLGAGQLFTWDSLSASYFGENAGWFPAVPFEDLPEKRYWVGIHKKSPPTADELKRASVLQPSLPVSVAGSEWLIPVARNLPRVFRLNPQGELTAEICEKHQDYWIRSSAFYNYFFGDLSFPYTDLWDFALLALSQNYRITREVVSHLGVCTSESFTQIISAACDIEAIVKEANESQKKNSSRRLIYLAWKSRLDPDYAPTWFDYWMLGREK